MPNDPISIKKKFTVLGDSLATNIHPGLPDSFGLHRGGINSRNFASLLHRENPALTEHIVVSLGANDGGDDPLPYWLQIMDFIGARQVTWLLCTNATRHAVRGLLHLKVLNGVRVFDTRPYVGLDKVHLAESRVPELCLKLMGQPEPEDWESWYAQAYALHRW